MWRWTTSGRAGGRASSSRESAAAEKEHAEKDAAGALSLHESQSVVTLHAGGRIINGKPESRENQLALKSQAVLFRNAESLELLESVLRHRSLNLDRFFTPDRAA